MDAQRGAELPQGTAKVSEGEGTVVVRAVGNNKLYSKRWDIRWLKPTTTYICWTKKTYTHDSELTLK